MTDQKPTGLFVRLPVTDEQAQEMYKAYCAAYDSSSLTTRGSATQAALLAIGTPVADVQIAALEAEIVRKDAQVREYRILLERIINKASLSCVRTLSGRDSRLLAGACADAREALKGAAV